jgi:hypothetical protein
MHNGFQVLEVLENPGSCGSVKLFAITHPGVTGGRLGYDVSSRAQEIPSPAAQRPTSDNISQPVLILNSNGHEVQVADPFTVSKISQDWEYRAQVPARSEHWPRKSPTSVMT